ncbi:MAG: hypothetical protein ACI8QS_001970, partial [Planctomycetota bacterium]
MPYTDPLIYVVLGALGALAGWWLRGRHHSIEKRTLVERFERSIRFHQEEQDKAVEALNLGVKQVKAME